MEPVMKSKKNSPRLELETLESRLTPANLSVTDAYLVDVGGMRVSEPTAGTLVRARVDFAADGLRDGAQFQIKFMFGDAAYARRAEVGPFSNFAVTDEYWLLKPGQRSFQVDLDALDEIRESDESDNFWVNPMLPATFSSPFQAETKFVTPIGGTNGVHWWINNYVDLDTGPGVLDPDGGVHAYDGQDAPDIDNGPVGSANLELYFAMGVGEPIFAAAGGVVAEVHDGEFDRNNAQNNKPANYVV